MEECVETGRATKVAGSDGIFELCTLNPFGIDSHLSRGEESDRTSNFFPLLYRSPLDFEAGIFAARRGLNTDNMASKCVHKGCGKEFTDAEEPCVYHPGPPVFHEGQKGKDLGVWLMRSRIIFVLFGVRYADCI